MKNEMEELFGPVIHAYTRAQALADGVLVDLSQALTPCPFKYPVAMTIGAYEATIAAGGKWESNGHGETLRLPAGQDIAGRVHDVFTLLQHGIDHPKHRTWVCACGHVETVSGIYDAKICPKCGDPMTPEPVQRVDFSVSVDIHGNGHRARVPLYSLCGPGDNAEPVITIMLPGED